MHLPVVTSGGKIYMYVIIICMSTNGQKHGVRKIRGVHTHRNIRGVTLI